MYDRHHFIEEPCAGKLASTVLKTGGVGDDLAEFNRQDADFNTLYGLAPNIVLCENLQNYKLLTFSY